MVKAVYAILFIFTFGVLAAFAQDNNSMSNWMFDPYEPYAITEEFLQNERICILGDTGTGTSRQLRVAKALAQENCTQVRITGDVIYGRGISSPQDSQLQKKFFKPYAELLNQNIPFYLVMGNHDYLKKPRAWIEVARNHPLIHFPNLWYVENYGGLCFFNLDSNKNFTEQSTWLNEMYNNMNCKKKIGLAHHPYKSMGSHGNASTRVRKFLRPNVIGKLDAYITGHDHNLAYEGAIGGTELFVSGAGAKLRSLSKSPKEGEWGVSRLGYLIFEPYMTKESKEIFVRYAFKALVGESSQSETLFTGEF
ncbi:MAG: hypothetical protein HOO06_07070 [Bdellovibrionaceae bacterium]|jgi:tartrate-resistant acid phosphatase type 5|nr:hypothetical protein [Pseudobdellovibrionaceae bacterium]